MPLFSTGIEDADSANYPQHSEKDNLSSLITVIISTKNRWPDLEKALLSLRLQSLTHKLIVMDDNSSDGTSEKVKVFFPEAELHSFDASRGYIVRRNQAICLSQTPYILSIDDDCILENTEILSEMAFFCLKSKSKAVAWPYVDVNFSSIRYSQSEGILQTHSFTGCAFLVQKEKFLEVGGFRECFIHQGEEEDFCIRLLQNGYPVLVGNGNVITHNESPKRSWERMDYFGSRNLILFAFFNVPFPLLPIQLAFSAFKAIIFGFKLRRPYHKMRGVLAGFRDGIKYYSKERKPVSIKTYLQYRKLKKNYFLLSKKSRSVDHNKSYLIQITI
jgi:GT2 family glycosyltransferase